MASILEVNDPATLAQHQMRWRALLGETPRRSFFHTYEWLAAFWRHFGAGLRMRVLLVRAAGETIGVAPLCVRTEHRRLGPVRVLTYPLDGWGVFFSPIGGAQSAVLRLAMRHVAQTATHHRDWDLIDLPWVDRDGADRGRTEQALQAAGLGCVATRGEASSVIDLTGGWGPYLVSRPPKTRHELRRGLRRLSGADACEHVRHRPAPASQGDGDPRWDLYDQCEEVAAHSWQAGLQQGNTLSHDRTRPFLREAHAAAARLGMVDVNLLRVGGRPVAFNYNYHVGGVVFGLRMGYRTDHPVKGAGKALLTRTLKDSAERGDARFELGPGDQGYKRRLRTAVEHNWRVRHTPWTSWRSQAVRLSDWARSLRPPRSEEESLLTKGKA